EGTLRAAKRRVKGATMPRSAKRSARLAAAALSALMLFMCFTSACKPESVLLEVEEPLLTISFIKPGLTSGVVEVGLEGDKIGTADSSALAAWYNGSALPGGSGNCIINGHMRWSGEEGAFAYLADIEPGEEVVITRKDESATRYQVTRKEEYPYDELPAWVLEAGGGDRLTLISCKGDYDVNAQTSLTRMVAVCELADAMKEDDAQKTKVGMIPVAQRGNGAGSEKPEDTKDIAAINARLIELGYPGVSEGEEYGAGTAAAVKLFQRQNGLMVIDGIVGEETSAALFQESARAYAMEAGYSYSSSDQAQALIDQARKMLGVKYVRNGKTKEGVDCGGLIYYCLNQIGVQERYKTSAQWRDTDYPTITGMEYLIPGDIICFNGHVGIYIGNDEMIDTSSSLGEVRLQSNLSRSSYWTRNFVCGKRVV
ncbi:sortase, partial [Christensenellaceae bacterium OttesenSCG-928-M15]|nr:sortase [Christensenellaceae bacterium OttesenSCG-928-M15]